MKKHFVWTGAIALAVTASTCVETLGGVILISTRKNVCVDQGADNVDEKGPGMTTPGDVAMSAVLGNHGYSCRLILDVLLGLDPATYLQPAGTDLKIDLVIWSGSSSSADVPTPPAGVPLMMGEHVTLGNNSGRAGSIYMYNGTASNDPNEASAPAATKYMKVTAPNHPIMAGIPLDAQGRVKIFREAYPDEERHVPAGGKKNFEYRWCTQAKADAAAGVTVLGVLDGAEDRTCLAVVDKGGMLANGQTASARMVHMFTNENGSGGSRRVFLAVTELGQLIFARAAKWAMGEEVPAHKAIRITAATPAGPQSVKVSWEGSARNNYKIQASLDLSTWQTVVDDLVGADGVLNRTLDLSATTQPIFLRIGAMP